MIVRKFVIYWSICKSTRRKSYHKNTASQTSQRDRQTVVSQRIYIEREIPDLHLRTIKIQVGPRIIYTRQLGIRRVVYQRRVLCLDNVERGCIPFLRSYAIRIGYTS